MADAISIQELIDARTDAKTLEQAVNGDAVTTVLSRLGETYPTLSNALNQIDSKLDSADAQIKQGITNLFENGGLPATPFATKALMTASALVDGDYAQVTDDTVNNGLYVKTSGAWVKSEYDPQKAAEKYSDTKTQFVEDSDLVRFEDDLGNAYARIAGNGDFFIENVKGSIQDAIKPMYLEDEDLFIFTDSNDTPVARMSGGGVLTTKDIEVARGSVNDSIVAQKNNTDYISKLNLQLDGLRVGTQEPLNKKIELLDAANFEGYKVLFGSAITRISKNKFYMAYDLRDTGGDYGNISIAGNIVEYDATLKTLTNSEPVTLASFGTTLDGVKYTYLNPMVTYVSKGANAGRILVHFNYMTNPIEPTDRIYEPYYVYSDDGGVTFTPPIAMGSMGLHFGSKGLLNFNGHGIQIQDGQYAGRLILPAYTHHSSNPTGTTGNTSSRVIYSDDGGDTYHVGADIDDPYKLLNEWQVAEVGDGKLVGIFRVGSGLRRRYTAHSNDGGITFNKPTVIPEISGAGTKTGLVNCKNDFDFSLPKLVAVAPFGILSSGNIRENPTVWLSYNNGKTWDYSKQIDDGYCQYSDAMPLDQDHILIIYGGGDIDRGNKIIAHIINLNFLLGE